METSQESGYKGLSRGFRELLERKKPIETLVTNGEAKRIWAKEERPSYQAVSDETKRIVDSLAVEHAKSKEFLPALVVRILGPTRNLTIDETTVFEKKVVIEGLRGRDTILSLKQKLMEDQSMDEGSPRIFLPPHELQDETRLGECYVQWPGFGLDSWPPKFVAKRKLKGFEMKVNIPAMENAVWEIVKGKRKLKKFCARRLILDLNESTTVGELKALIEQHVGIPFGRQLLSAEVDGTFFGSAEGEGYIVDLDEDSCSMEQHGIDRFGRMIHLRVNRFDCNGDFDFAHANFLEEGCHFQQH